jgi:UDP:flavonoid glycosyltransferase YjiC (YdhE family)
MQAAKFLVLFMQFGGHVSEFASVTQGLLDNGHEVHMVVDENLLPNFKKRLAGTKAKFLTYKSPDADFVSEETVDERFSIPLLTGVETDKVFRSYLVPRLTHDCRLPLQDEELFQRIKEIKFDMAILNGLYFCYHVIPHRLGIPYVNLSTREFPLLVRVHPLVGHLGCCISRERNTFLNRFKQFVKMLHLDWSHGSYVDESQFPSQIYSPEKPYASLRDLAINAQLWLITQDNLIDCPRPTNPNVILVGAISASPARPLPHDLALIADDAINGIILFSFGSMLDGMPMEMQEKFASTFRKLQQVVIWKSRIVKVALPNNVHVLKWMPQNDLLGHKNVKLFITHCGNNGNSEAVYHGVPMLAMPVCGDGLTNADRVEFLGHGRSLSVSNFTSDDLYKTIQDILNNPNYATKINKASEILKNKPRHPRQEAAYWIEHVLEYGNSHLRTTLSYMNLVEFLMVDIYVFLTCILLFLLYVAMKVASSIWTKVLIVL